jgi:quercetin dioxygenase-like cupin family protein
MAADITRALLQTSAVVGMPGWEMRLLLVTYPPGADASGHSHPVVGVGLVLEGSMLSAFEDAEPELLTTGQSFLDKAGVHTISRNASDSDPLTFLVAFTVKTGEPNTIWPEKTQ